MLVTAILALVHLTTRTPEVEGSVLVNGEAVSIASLDLEQVTGTIVNGKGEEKQIDAQGINIAKLFDGDYESITITASDEYSAVVNADETDNAYLILDDDGNPGLVVFGDSNSKRCVRDVVRIDFQ